MVCSTLKEGKKDRLDHLRARRYRFDTNHARVPVQGQHCPVAEILIQGDKDAILSNGESEDLRIVFPRHPSFTNTAHIVADCPEIRSNVTVYHLIEQQAKETHHAGGLDSISVCSITE